MRWYVRGLSRISETIICLEFNNFLTQAQKLMSFSNLLFKMTTGGTRIKLAQLKVDMVLQVLPKKMLINYRRQFKVTLVRWHVLVLS